MQHLILTCKHTPKRTKLFLSGILVKKTKTKKPQDSANMNVTHNDDKVKVNILTEGSSYTL